MAEFLRMELIMAKDFREYIEELKDLKRICNIRFRNVEGAVSIIRAHIVKTENVSGREIFETDAGLVIGLDQVLEINGQVPENYC
jgi:hypothetical protein